SILILRPYAGSLSSSPSSCSISSPLPLCQIAVIRSVLFICWLSATKSLPILILFLDLYHAEHRYRHIAQQFGYPTPQRESEPHRPTLRGFFECRTCGIHERSGLGMLPNHPHDPLAILNPQALLQAHNRRKSPQIHTPDVSLQFFHHSAQQWLSLRSKPA